MSIKRDSNQLSKKQIKELLDIQHICLPEDDPVIPKEHPKGTWFLVYETQLIGFGLVIPSKQWRDTAYLARCCVYPNSRGKGLQKKLIRLRERYMRFKNYTWMITDTSTDNPASSNSLIRCKYKIIFPTNPWANENSIYWAKKL